MLCLNARFHHVVDRTHSVVRRLVTHPVVYILAAAAVVLEVLAALYIGLSKPHLLSNVEALTEVVSVRVGDGSKAAFPIYGMRMWLRDQVWDSGCPNGLLIPADDSTVTFSRVGMGEVEITVKWDQIKGESIPSKPVAQYYQENQDPILLKTGLIEFRSEKDCGRIPPTEWPIWGDISLGREFQPAKGPGERAPSFMIHGEIKVEARSAWFDTTYRVDPVTLPVGGRLESARVRPIDPPSLWWGLAYVDPQKPALVVAAGTEARTLRIFRPLTREPEVVELTFFTQFFDDPAWRLLHVFTLTCGFLWFIGTERRGKLPN